MKNNAPDIDRVKALLSKPYARRLVPDEDGGFFATIQEFPGCIAQGDSAEEALRNLESAAESWLEAQLELGQDIPEPIDFFGYSGKVALRLPRGIHKQAAELAQSEGTSVNQLLVTAISSYVSAKGVVRKVMESFHSPGIRTVIVHTVYPNLGTKEVKYASIRHADAQRYEIASEQIGDSLRTIQLPAFADKNAADKQGLRII